MRRYGLILLAVLALCLSSYLAATQSVAMAAARHGCAGPAAAGQMPAAAGAALPVMAHSMGHMADHPTKGPDDSHDPHAGGRAGPGQPLPCPDRAGCAWVCAWACTALVVASAPPDPAAPLTLPRLAPRLVDRPIPEGTQPALTDRPPILLS